MNILSLNGEWQLTEINGETSCQAKVPGCNYEDLINAGIIEEPYENLNEAKSLWVYEKDWEYKRSFDVSGEMLKHERIELVCEMLDTLCTLYINDAELAKTDNIHRTYSFDIKPLLKEGKNYIKAVFHCPSEYLEQRKKLLALPKNVNSPIIGTPHLRKPACHFGWDFAPTLPPAGISRDIYIRIFDNAKIDDVTVAQRHSEGKVTLEISVELDCKNSFEGEVQLTVCSPENEKTVVRQKISKNNFTIEAEIKNPQLWWPNGLGAQPRYSVKIEVENENGVSDSRELKIGLRTAELNTQKDEFGSNFCFYINSVPIFAKGANFIPPDIIRTRVTREKLYSLLMTAKNANMNLIRVWGGGYYESNEFYDICDELGILVWQDMNFACNAYPLPLQDFVDNVLLEIRDNIKRIKNHPSLVLYCGNNEIESMSLAWRYRTDIIKATGEFFYETLPAEIRKYDKITPYWACTPSSGEYMKGVNGDACGDTHLWHVWHGLRNFEYYRKRFTRFCSEFGLESYPTYVTLQKFIDGDKLEFGTDVVNAHQKCDGGDIKMLYYLLDRWWEPKNFEHLVYLTQLSQAECIRDASEHWHRNMSRCHGSLYWQFNDCWCGTSWASLDYLGGYKALHYAARHFNEPVSVSLENDYNNIKIFTINDTLETVKATVRWSVCDFDGKVIKHDEIPVVLSPVSAEKAVKLKLGCINAISKKNTVFTAELTDEKGTVISQRRCLFEKENRAKLSNPQLELSVSGDEAEQIITVKANKYARYVFITATGLTTPFSDNFFDLGAGEEKVVTVQSGMTAQELQKKLSVMSLYDVGAKNTRARDRMTRAKIFMMPLNLANWFSRFFDK